MARIERHLARPREISLSLHQRKAQIGTFSWTQRPPASIGENLHSKEF